MINEKIKSNRKFNIIDVFVIILAVICILGIYFRGRIKEWIGIDKQLSEYQLSFKVSNIKYTSEKHFVIGEKIFLDTPELELGTIDGSCVILSSEIYLKKTDGTTVKVNYPKNSYIDITGNIRCVGTEREDGFYLSGTYSIAPGMTLNVHTEMLDFTLTVTDISKYTN